MEKFDSPFTLLSMFVVVVGLPRLKLLVTLVNDKYWHFYCYILQCCCYTGIVGYNLTSHHYNHYHTTLHSLHFSSHNHFSLDLLRSEILGDKTRPLNSIAFHQVNTTKPLFASNDLNAGSETGTERNFINVEISAYRMRFLACSIIFVWGHLRSMFRICWWNH